MTFEPVVPEGQTSDVHIPLAQLAADVREVLQGEGGEFLQTLLLVGGSPQGARPKALVYRNPETNLFTTAVTPGFEAWLVKFPAKEEHAEVCAIEMVYAECLRLCHSCPVLTGQIIIISPKYSKAWPNEADSSNERQSGIW